ncbi:MAG: FAD-binding oxidoreductase [Actinomycetota bacterium]|nr:FAD-binding oxidoreductase [Actinomycetota bacterium]
MHTELQLPNQTDIIDVEPLRARLTGDVFAAGDVEWDAARQAWNLAVDQRPTAVVFPESAEDVAATIEFAREHGLRVAPQGTGHNAAAMGSLDGTILLKTSRMRGVTIDAKNRIARVEAGVISIEVVEAAAEHGLAALAGSSPDVGVVGYTLGGGLSWLARKHGIGANNVAAVEIVTADGRLVRADADNAPDLFWAVRGGGGNFGVVTAIELRLFPITEVYAGILWFPVERAAEVLNAWRVWTDDLPDEMTSVGRILQFPPIPAIPEPVRGQSFVVVEAIYCGDEAEGARLLEPLRALGPVMDTVATMPIEQLSHLHMDPEEPVPAAGDGGMLTDVDSELIERVVEKTVGTPILSFELRHLGGAVARSSAEHGAVSCFDSPYLTFAVGFVPTAEAGAAVHASIAAVRDALAPWEAEHTYMNFAESRRSAKTLFSEEAYDRLRAVKAAYDPGDVIRSNHPLVTDAAVGSA